jgi:hypothetical protein
MRVFLKTRLTSANYLMFKSHIPGIENNVRSNSALIPQDPVRVEYLQGNALGEKNTNTGFELSSFSNIVFFFGTTRKARSLFIPWLMMKIQNALTRVGMMPIACSTRC